MLESAAQADLFGYYQVGNQRTYSKLQAIEWHQTTGHHPIWHFNDMEFGAWNWKLEPTETLPELYRLRAQNLRDQYDYLVLMYSGGADSTNILDTFVNNHIPLDECASFWAHNAERGMASNFNIEVGQVAIPRMQTLPHIPHRLLDLSDIQQQVFEVSDVKFDWIYFMNTYWSPNNFVRSHLRELVPEYRRMIDSGKSMCFIWGSDKPRIYTVSGRRCVRFQDLIDNAVSPWRQQYVVPGQYDQLFYWSPDWTQGIIKQAHVVRRFLDTASINPLYFRAGGAQHYGSTVRNGQTWNLTATGINHLLYPTWDIFTISAGKSRSPMRGQRDDWFFNNATWNPAVQNFDRSMQKLEQTLTQVHDGYWRNDPLDFDRGVRGCLSQPYFLE